MHEFVDSRCHQRPRPDTLKKWTQRKPEDGEVIWHNRSEGIPQRLAWLCLFCCYQPSCVVSYFVSSIPISTSPCRGHPPSLPRGACSQKIVLRFHRKLIIRSQKAKTEVSWIWYICRNRDMKRSNHDETTRRLNKVTFKTRTWAQKAKAERAEFSPFSLVRRTALFNAKVVKLSR